MTNSKYDGREIAEAKMVRRFQPGMKCRYHDIEMRRGREDMALCHLCEDDAARGCGVMLLVAISAAVGYFIGRW